MESDAYMMSDMMGEAEGVIDMRVDADDWLYRGQDWLPSSQQEEVMGLSYTPALPPLFQLPATQCVSTPQANLHVFTVDAPCESSPPQQQAVTQPPLDAPAPPTSMVIADCPPPPASPSQQQQRLPSAAAPKKDIDIDIEVAELDRFVMEAPVCSMPAAESLAPAEPHPSAPPAKKKNDNPRDDESLSSGVVSSSSDGRDRPSISRLRVRVPADATRPRSKRAEAALRRDAVRRARSSVRPAAAGPSAEEAALFKATTGRRLTLNQAIAFRRGRREKMRITSLLPADFITPGGTDEITRVGRALRGSASDERRPVSDQQRITLDGNVYDVTQIDAAWSEMVAGGVADFRTVSRVDVMPLLSEDHLFIGRRHLPTTILELYAGRDEETDAALCEKHSLTRAEMDWVRKHRSRFNHMPQNTEPPIFTTLASGRLAIVDGHLRAWKFLLTHPGFPAMSVCHIPLAALAPYAATS